MSNQPKITYRSDTTGCNYHMHLKNNSYTIQIEPRSGEPSKTSERFNCELSWRLTIEKFFLMVDNHINRGEWMP